MTVKELKEMIKNLDDNATVAFVYHEYTHGYTDNWWRTKVDVVMTDEEYEHKRDNKAW